MHGTRIVADMLLLELLDEHCMNNYKLYLQYVKKMNHVDFLYSTHFILLGTEQNAISCRDTYRYCFTKCRKCYCIF